MKFFHSFHATHTVCFEILLLIMEEAREDFGMTLHKKYCSTLHLETLNKKFETLVKVIWNDEVNVVPPSR